MVKTLRRVGAFFGKFIDADDRKVLGGAIVLASGFALAVLTVAVSTGLALRAFEIARG